VLIHERGANEILIGKRLERPSISEADPGLVRGSAAYVEESAKAGQRVAAGEPV
jgi:hypothetical protein